MMNNNFFFKFMNINTLSASSGGSSIGAWIFLIIFFGIIAALIIVAVVGSKKDKIEKLVENDKRKKMRTQASADRIALFASLNNIILNLEKDVDNFKPSVGLKSLGEINKEASYKINKIIESDELKNIYLSEDFKNEIKPILNELSKSKPSNWGKEATFATSLVKAKFNSISTNEENKEDIKRGINIKWK